MLKSKLLVAGVLVVAGCATAGKTAGLQIGMTRADVIEKMGPPDSISAQADREYLNYALYETDDDAYYGQTRPYYVRLVNGRVESYGRTGDFDSTRTPTIRIETDQKVRQDINSNQTPDRSKDLYTELVKLKELRETGLITEDEFQAQKKKLLEQK